MGSLEHHIKRKFMIMLYSLIKTVKSRKTQGTAQMCWSVENIYNTLVRKHSEMAV